MSRIFFCVCHSEDPLVLVWDIAKVMIDAVSLSGKFRDACNLETKKSACDS